MRSLERVNIRTNVRTYVRTYSHTYVRDRPYIPSHNKYRNWIINEVARAGEHTNERTYVRTYSHTYVRDRPYIPSTTLLCEGINRVHLDEVAQDEPPHQDLHCLQIQLFLSRVFKALRYLG